MDSVTLSMDQLVGGLIMLATLLLVVFMAGMVYGIDFERKASGHGRKRTTR